MSVFVFQRLLYADKDVERRITTVPHSVPTKLTLLFPSAAPLIFFKELEYVVCVYEIFGHCTPSQGLCSNLQTETKLINWLSICQGCFLQGEFNVSQI